MPEQNHNLPWTQPGWRAEASAWFLAELEKLGFHVSGSVEQPHVRPWSTVLRVSARERVFYLKATAPVLGYEAQLTQALFTWRPYCMPQVLAADPERSWMVMPEFGPSMRSQIQSPAGM